MVACLRSRCRWPIATWRPAASRSPVRSSTIEDAEQLAHRFKALGDPTRVRLLSLIAAYDEREACICDLTEPVGLSQPTVSHHMKQLADAGLVTREQRGKWAYYRIVDDALASLAWPSRRGQVEELTISMVHLGGPVRL